VPVELSFCVVNTEQRPLLRYCLDAIARERATVDFETEVLVLDNASGDGSVDAARSHPVTTEVIAQDRRRGKAENDTALLRRARGRFCLLLNEDSELEPGATVALHAALADDDSAGAAGAQLVSADGQRLPSAWRFPSISSALLGAVGLHRRLVVQSRGDAVRRVDWSQSAALLVRRSAFEGISGFDERLFMYAEDCDLSLRIRQAGYRIIWTPFAELYHLESASRGKDRAPEKARRFAGDLAVLLTEDRIGVRLCDERLSTVSAEQVLREQGRKGTRRRAVVDQAAAVVILQNALDTERGTGRPAGETLTPTTEPGEL
jgi:GT2 family glycosyltransferase